MTGSRVSRTRESTAEMIWNNHPRYLESLKLSINKVALEEGGKAGRNAIVVPLDLSYHEYTRVCSKDANPPIVKSDQIVGD